jgi:hypothetical protein
MGGNIRLSMLGQLPSIIDIDASSCSPKNCVTMLPEETIGYEQRAVYMASICTDSHKKASIHLLCSVNVRLCSRDSALTTEHTVLCPARMT